MTVFTDSRITEASGLACSTKYANRLYTHKDEGTAPVVFTIQITTGNTVGTCSIAGHTLEDPESCATDRQGRLWLGDIGDNDADRTNVAVYMRDEPGDHDLGAIAWSRFPITYPDGPVNAETFAIQPATNARYIISKEAASAIYRLPAKLRQNAANVPTKLTPTLGAFVTDAVFSIDGRWLFSIRKDEPTTIYVHQPTGTTWNQVGTIVMPSLTKPEGLAIARNGLSLYVTEDKATPGAKLNTVSIPASYHPKAAPPPPSPPANPTPAPSPCT